MKATRTAAEIDLLLTTLEEIAGNNFVVETIMDRRSGSATIGVRRRVETRLPLSAEEREQLRCIGEVLQEYGDVEDMAGVLGMASAAKAVMS